MSSAKIFLLLCGLLALAGCGDFPRPFMGAPGATAMRLAQPPPARLAVPAPEAALLSDAAAQALAHDVALALQAREVPAVDEPARPGDWVLRISATLQGDAVRTHYAVIDPRGKEMGATDAPALPGAAWSAGNDAVLHGQAEAMAPELSQLLAGIDAALRMSDPNSLFNRPSRVFIPDGIGAPGDGNTALARAMRVKLPGEGVLVQDKPEGADYVVRPVVVIVPQGASERVEIQWILSDPRGEAGRIVQLNEVPRGTLAGLWGDIAAVVADEAVDGIRQVIANRIGAKPGAKPGGTAPTAAAAGAGEADGPVATPAEPPIQQPPSAGPPAGATAPAQNPPHAPAAPPRPRAGSLPLPPIPPAQAP